MSYEQQGYMSRQEQNYRLLRKIYPLGIQDDCKSRDAEHKHEDTLLLQVNEYVLI